MSDHVLDLTLDDDGPHLSVRCVHPDDGTAWWTVDPYDEAAIPELRCWVPDWNANIDVATEALHGEWPSNPSFPLPVTCEWDEGLIVTYGGEAKAERSEVQP